MKNLVSSFRFMRAVRDVAKTPPILCPSIGRVGSTLLWKELSRSRARALLASESRRDLDAIRREKWTLAGARFAPGTVIKTHDFPHQLQSRGPLRIVFLFGRPSDVVVSVLRCRETKGPEWIAEHLRHLHANGPLDAIFDRDVLRIEEQIDSWLGLRGFDLLGIHYDALWHHRDTLSRFVGFDVVLPPRIERKLGAAESALVERAREAYAALDAKVAALPVCQRIER